MDALLYPQLGNDWVVESFTIQPLTQPRDNFGSILLAIEVGLLCGADRTSSHNLSLVAKLVPPYGFLWKIYGPPNTVCKEISCYTLVKQENKKLQNENCIHKEKFLDAFPRRHRVCRTLL
jgi:hypothetical protein